MIRICSLLFFLGVASCLTSQSVLKGYVKDENDVPYQKTKVTIEQITQFVYTDENGFYQFENIPEGIYALSVDYLYDKKYLTVTISGRETFFEVILHRRIEFDEILVKANQMDISTYSNATKLGSEKLESMSNEKDLPFILKNIAGLVVQSDAGNGIGYTGLRMRGLDPSHIQLTINGIPYNDSESGLSYYVDIPDIISYTEEITVFKGNVPNRGGTPSFGGAIDMNTNKVSFDPYVALRTQVGSYNSVKFSLSANSGLLDNTYNLEFGLSRQKSDGYIERSDSELKSFRISAAIIKKNVSSRFNYIHGSERTGQAWFGLPVQYDGINQLRRFNLAGTEKPGEPYADEKDNYKQDHVQFFYQREVKSGIILNASLNYTGGSGFYENYKANQFLQPYAIISPSDSVADLIRKPWLQNDFIFGNLGLFILVNNKITITPSVNYSYYKGDHFGIVSWVDLDKYEYLKGRYYENTGVKQEFSTSLKTLFKPSDRVNLSVDLQYRNIDYRIDGKLMNGKAIHSNNTFHIVNPRLFGDFKLNRQLQLFASAGHMQREPFREDIILQDSGIKPEEMYDFELGSRYTSKRLQATFNSYAMLYQSQFALSGKINEVGEALRTNIGKSHRLGIELETEFRLTDDLSIWNASNFSSNKIEEIEENIPVYSQDFELLRHEITTHKQTDISFSPNQVIHSGLRLNILEESKAKPSVSIQVSHHYISSYFLDNYSSSQGRMKAYQYFECGFVSRKYIQGLGDLELRLSIYNLSNQQYASHGWISKFRSQSQLDIQTDPYLAHAGENNYYYKASYPQALRHFNLGLNIKFR